LKTVLNLSVPGTKKQEEVKHVLVFNSLLWLSKTEKIRKLETHGKRVTGTFSLMA
jgi:hypothetical protein